MAAPAPAKPAVAPNNPLLNPNAPLSGPALLQAAQALVNAQTQGPTAELQQQIAQNNRQAQGAINQTGGYFNQLGQFVKQGVTDQANIASGLNSQLQGIGQQEQQQLQGIGQNATDSLLKYAPQSDASHSLANPALQSLQQEIARQQGLAAQNQGAFRSFGATQGANYQGLAASNLGTYGLRGQEALKGIAQAAQLKNEPLTAKLAGIAASKGPLLATTLGKLRQQEITNSITRAGLGIKQETAAAALQNAAAHTTSANASARNAGTNAKNSAFNTNPSAVGSPAWGRVQNAQGKQWSNNPNAVGSPAWARAQKANASANGKAKPLSTLENNHFWATIGQIEQLIQDGQAKGHQGQINGWLQSGQNPSKRSFDPFLIRVADQLLGYGSIDQATASQLTNGYGVNIGTGTFRGKPIKVTPTYNASNPAMNPPGLAGGVGSAITGAGNAIGNAVR